MKLRDFLKKADLLIIVPLLVLGFASLLVIISLNGKKGNTVEISVDGKPYGEYSLLEDRTFEISTEYGSNTVCISGGKVCISESDCPNHDCERFGKISAPGQTITCLPHRLVLAVSGEPDVDTVSY